MKTPLETLYACRNHWQWLWITGSASKRSYPPADNWPFECACCLYAGAYFKDNESIWNIDITDRDCTICPLNNYAWSTNINEWFEAAFCENSDDSIYNHWLDDPSPENAYRMVQACNRAIEDILCKS